MGKQVLNLKRICLCSDSLSNIWSLGPLLSEHSRHRSVKAVKLRSSGSVIAKHLMRRSRRQELSMCTVVAGDRVIACRGCRQGGVAPPLRPGGTGCARLPTLRPTATAVPPRPRPPSYRPPCFMSR